MAKAAVATPSVDLEAIDRLEQKLKQLVAVLHRTRAEGARATDELVRTRADGARATEDYPAARRRARGREKHAAARRADARTRLVDAEGTAPSCALRSEREHPHASATCSSRSMPNL
jgi:hypothetical protein